MHPVCPGPLFCTPLFIRAAWSAGGSRRPQQPSVPPGTVKTEARAEMGLKCAQAAWAHGHGAAAPRNWGSWGEGASLLMQPHDLDLSPLMRGGAGDTEGAVSIVVLVTGTQESWCRGLGDKTPHRTGARGSIHSPYFSVEPKPQCRETAVPRMLPALGAPGPGPQLSPSGGHRGCPGLLWEE